MSRSQSPSDPSQSPSVHDLPTSVPVIAIDGPTASGKGTVAARVAAHLGWHLLDSGALYRLVALHSLRTGWDVAQADALAQWARTMPITFERGGQILLANEVVTDAIRQEAVGNRASEVAALPSVRTALLDWQRARAVAPGLVADGRDMGTVVFPEAPLKIFLTASAQARADRRTKQLIEKENRASMPGYAESLRARVLEDILQRDWRDTHRAHAPLAAASDAYTLDSTLLNVDQVVAQILHWWADRSAVSRSH